jgi:hypothetical protein
MQNQLPQQAWQDRLAQVTENAVPADPVFQLPGRIARHGHDFDIPLHALELAYRFFARHGRRTRQRKIEQDQVKLPLLRRPETAASGGCGHYETPAQFQRISDCLRRLLIVFRKEHFHRITFSTADRAFALFIGKPCARPPLSTENCRNYLYFYEIAVRLPNGGDHCFGEFSPQQASLGYCQYLVLPDIIFIW